MILWPGYWTWVTECDFNELGLLNPSYKKEIEPELAEPELQEIEPDLGEPELQECEPYLSEPELQPQTKPNCN